MDDADSGLWLSIAEIARQKNISRQSVAERVARFEEAGLIATRPGKGRSKLVNLAEFDRAADERTDIAKAHGAETARQRGRASYNAAITQRAQYDAELRKLELAERLGKVVPVDDLKQVAEQCGIIVLAVIERLPDRAESLVAAAVGGVGGMKAALKSIVVEQRTKIAAAYEGLATSQENPASAADTSAAAAIELPFDQQSV